jgi:hypothetical protein
MSGKSTKFEIAVESICNPQKHRQCRDRGKSCSAEAFESQQALRSSDFEPMVDGGGDQEMQKFLAVDHLHFDLEEGDRPLGFRCGGKFGGKSQREAAKEAASSACSDMIETLKEETGGEFFTAGMVCTKYLTDKLSG